MFGFAVRNAFRRKGIAIFAILGTALGCTLMTVLLSISIGMDRQMTETMNKMAGDVIIYPQNAPMAFMMGGSISLPASYVEEIEKMEHVAMVSPSVIAFIPTGIADFGDPVGVSIAGVDLERDAEFEGATYHIIEGRSIQAEDEVIVGQLLYVYDRRVGLDTANIGSTFTMPLMGKPGESIELKVVGIFETGSLFEDFFIYGDLNTIQAMAGIDGVNSITVRAESTDNVEEVATAIKDRYQDSAFPVSVMVAKDVLGEINEAMGTFHNFLWVIALIAAIAGGISIFIIMLISVIERTKEFGILKASGWSNGNILSSVVVQSISIALLGALAGLGIGIGAGYGIDWYLHRDIAVFTASLIAFVGGFGLIVGIIGGLYPAVRAVRVSPIESMRAI